MRWIGSAAAVIILIALFGIWRLMQGPIELDWLAPYVEAGLDRSGMGLKVAISGVRLALDRNTHELNLRAQKVRVSLPGGEPVASFPEMSTSFAVSALLRGKLEPTQVVVERPVLHLVRDAGGAISARIGTGDQGAPDLGPQMLQNLAGPREREAPLGLLRELRIRGATVAVEDRRSGQTWRADRVDLSVERSAKGVRGSFSLAMPMAGSIPEARAAYRYFADRQILDLDLSIEGVRPADIPPLIPELDQLRHIEAPISGTLRTRIDLAQHRPLGSRLDLALGGGRLRSEWLASGNVAVDSGELHAVYAPEDSAVRVEALRLDLGGGTELVLSGALGGVSPELIAAPADARPPGHVTGRFDAALKHVPVARLPELWPPSFSRGARKWVLANIRDGILDEAAAQLGLDLDPTTHDAEVVNATGSLRYRDLTINYFNGLPMARQVAGTANFADNRLDFLPAGGQLKGLKLTGGTVRISDIGGRPEWLTIDLTLAGPLQDALDVIDSKPLRYAHAIGIDPAHVGGRAETQLHFRMPLLADLKLDAVEYGAKATITSASLPKIVFGRGLSDANLTLDIAAAGAHVQGAARFDGIPTKLDASVFFHPKSGPRSVYRVALTLDDEAQRRLDLDFLSDRLKGPVAADLTYSTFAGNRGEAVALLDLRGASLAIAEAGWTKPADQPGTAKIVLDVENETIARIPQIDIKAAGLDGQFAASLGADKKRVERVDIRRLLVGETDVSGTVSRRPAGGWSADIHAARADARHLLKDASSGAPSVPSPPLAVKARADRLVLGAQRELRQVTASLLRSGGVWQSGQLEGRFVNGHRLSLNFDESNGHRLTFQSDDLGATLQALDIADGVVGGQISIDGQISQIGGERSIRAHVEGANYTLVRAPVMTRILALPSLTGFASMLSGTGLPFMTLRGDFVYGGGRLKLERLLASGESLGVTAEGWVDPARNRLELRGTVAPAYALNSLLDNVPIVGQLLGGGAQGLFAANFRLSGPTADPQVTVNPLSALAPGVLRQLFAPIVGVPAPQPEQQAAH